LTNGILILVDTRPPGTPPTPGHHFIDPLFKSDAGKRSLRQKPKAAARARPVNCQ
jgi:hypothetical protein